MTEHLAVAPQADPPAVTPRVIDVDASPERPLVEITTSPVTKEPIVRIGAGRKRSGGTANGATAPATASVQARNGATTPRTDNRDDRVAGAAPADAETAVAPGEITPMDADDAGAQAPAQSDTGALQQGRARARQAVDGVVAGARTLMRPVKARVDDIRAKILPANSKARTEPGEDDANDAKGDLKRIAATLDGKSGGGDGDGGGNRDANSPAGGVRRILGLIAAQAEAALTAVRRMLARNGINSLRDVGDKIADAMSDLAAVAFALRLGVGTLFVIGGWNKLSKLLSPAHSDGLVASYTSTTGYINEFFMGYLFAPGSALTPWTFLTTLSAFELVTGMMLLAGLLVRPVALIYAFLLWSFVIALPVVTTNGVDPGVNTYMAPALLVQIRDVALSGIMFALFGLGSGIRSLDVRVFGQEAAQPIMSWDVAGVLLRLSTAVVLIVGGAFAGMPNIKTFIEPGLVLFALGLMLLWGGRPARYAAGATCAVLVIYMLGKIGIDKGLLGSLNAVKRELALFAGAFVIAARGCGELWTATDVARRLNEGFAAAVANLGARAPRAEKVG